MPSSWDISDRTQYEDALRFIVEGTVAKTGADFYHACVRSLADIFQVQYAFVTELVDDSCQQSRMLSLWTGQSFVEPYEFDLAGTPCQLVFQNTWGIFHNALQTRFPGAAALATLGAESYLGVIIKDSQGKAIGNLGFIDTKPLADDISIAKSILQLFAARVGAEMERHADKIKLQNYAVAQAELYAESLAKSEALQQTLEELQRTQTQMVHSEKMSSLGQLVAGIAHEINNPVNFIHGNVNYAQGYVQDLVSLLELYQQSYPKPMATIAQKNNDIDINFLREDLPKLFNSMKAGTERIREIVQSLRLFSRLDESDVKPVDLHAGIDSALMILQSRLKGESDRQAITVTQRYGALPEVLCFAGQLNQVFMNILLNAIDALENKRLLIGEQPTIEIVTEQQDDRVLIQFTDNGIGIPEAMQSQIFNPFFTTKSVGKGTGMGLSISYQIITENHGGKFCLHSEVGRGTTFTIRIPIGT
jgi:two-component system, NtrC family, sensor kinase